MLGKELKHLNRKELVDIIYQLKKNEDEMKAEIESLKKQLEDKHFKLSVAGSIAEASVSVTNLLTAAQMTADLYLQEIEQMKEATEIECAKMLEDAKEKCGDTFAEDFVVRENKKVEIPKVEIPKEDIKSEKKDSEIDIDDIFANLNAFKEMLKK